MTHRGRVSTFALTLIGLGTACDWGPSQWPPEGTYSVLGTVTEVTSAGVTPVRGIYVTGWRGSTATDSSGRYRFMGVQPGARTFRIEAGPFETITQTVNVTADSVVDFRLVRRPRFTLSGFVTEDTPAGTVPLAGIELEVEFCPPPMAGYDFVPSRTDARGFYSVPDLCEGRTAVFAALNSAYTYATGSDGCDDGHGTECRWATIAGDTRFDIRLIKR